MRQILMTGPSLTTLTTHFPHHSSNEHAPTTQYLLFSISNWKELLLLQALASYYQGTEVALTCTPEKGWACVGVCMRTIDIGSDCGLAN